MSNIAYCHLTINPCPGCSRVKVSRGCDHCYAQGLARTRLLRLPQYAGLTDEAGNWTGKIGWNPKALEQIRRLRNFPAGHVTKEKPWLDGFSKIVFVNDMGDLFADEVSPGNLRRVAFAAELAAQRGIKFIFLTKRYERMVDFLWNFMGHNTPCPIPFPIAAGFSVCTQADADRAFPLLPRLAEIVEVPFLSLEPLLEYVDVKPALPHLKWVIVGGESGAKARPFEYEWVEDIAVWCEEEKVPFFFKQWGSHSPGPLDKNGMPSMFRHVQPDVNTTEMPLAWRPK